MHAMIQEAAMVALIISLVPMVAIALGAGLVALLQAVTQVQEQSLVHLARIIVITIVLVWGGQQAFSELESMFVKIVVSAGSMRR